MPKKSLSELDPEDFGFEDEGEVEQVYPSIPERASLPVVRQLWSPRPLPPPAIDPDFDRMGWLERSAEVIRFSFLSLEYWLSQRGILREWLRLNLWVAMVLLSAAILIVPPSTAVLEGAVEFTGLFGRIVENTTEAILKLPPVVLGIATLLVLFRLFYRHWQRRRRSRLGYGQAGYEEEDFR